MLLMMLFSLQIQCRLSDVLHTTYIRSARFTLCFILVVTLGFYPLSALAFPSRSVVTATTKLNERIRTFHKPTTLYCKGCKTSFYQPSLLLLIWFLFLPFDLIQFQTFSILGESHIFNLYFSLMVFQIKSSCLQLLQIYSNHPLSVSTTASRIIQRHRNLILS